MLRHLFDHACYHGLTLRKDDVVTTGAVATAFDIPPGETAPERAVPGPDADRAHRAGARLTGQSSADRMRRFKSSRSTARDPATVFGGSAVATLTFKA